MLLTNDTEYQKAVLEELHLNPDPSERREKPRPSPRFASQVLGEVLAEFGRAHLKLRPFASRHEGYAVIKEEVDERWDAIK